MSKERKYYLFRKSMTQLPPDAQNYLEQRRKETRWLEIITVIVLAVFYTILVLSVL